MTSLGFGRETLAIPGPSIIPDRVLQAMHRPSPNIYEGELIEITSGILRDLRRVARSTEAQVAMYVANGHGAWEAAIANTLAPGDRALVLATGRFGLGWAEVARRMGVEVEILDFGSHAPADPDRLADRLRAPDGDFKAVLTVQTDTATSVSNDIAGLGQAVRAVRPDALFMVDSIASLGCEQFEMDAWDVDVMVAACQKGLMTPAGMSFNFARPRALDARAALHRTSPYFDWLPRLEPKIYYQYFGGTPPTQHLFGLREALTMILEEEGLDAVWARHFALARTVWAAAEVWAELGAIRLNIAAASQRSRAVTTLHTGPGDADRLRAWCASECGLTLGVGLGLGDALSAPIESLFRIGHMGHLNPPMLLGTLATIDAGLKTLDIAHGGGALRVASQTIAAHFSQTGG